MTRSQNLEVVRKACVEANPNKNWMRIDNGREYEEEPVRLADVMNTLNRDGRFERRSGSSVRFYFYRSRDAAFIWNLLKDLDGQTDSTLQFLADILSKG